MKTTTPCGEFLRPTQKIKCSCCIEDHVVSSWCAFLILDLTWATWRVSCRKQRLHTLTEHLSLPPVFGGVHVVHMFLLSVVFVLFWSYLHCSPEFISCFGFPLFWVFSWLNFMYCIGWFFMSSCHFPLVFFFISYFY